jgi:UDP-N-acetylmuramoyl-L-alanine---L-glutamate ligase
MEEIIGDKILILGYGREGKSVHTWLQKHYPNVQIHVADRKTDGASYLQKINYYDTVVRSPGVSPYQPEIIAFHSNNGHMTSATNIFFSRVKGTTIGVTGTKGKSTTSSLIAHILHAIYSDVRLVGNIGSPMLDQLDTATEETIFVIELSSHQLVDARYSPHIAVLLRIVPEHLDYYPDFAAYKSAKANILKFQNGSDVAFCYPFTPYPFKNSSLLGNVDNIYAAVSVAKYFDISDDAIARALKTFSPLPHRIEFVGEFRGIQFYNDSLATIPEATIHGLCSLGDRVSTLIAGGFDRGIAFVKLGEYIAKTKLKTIILFPETGEKIWNAIPSNTQNMLKHIRVKTMGDAVAMAYKHTPVGKICLLSPASASYNLFKDYADRGEQFKTLVKKFA